MSPLFTRNMKHTVSDIVTSPINHDVWYRKKQSVAINNREFGNIKLYARTKTGNDVIQWSKEF